MANLGPVIGSCFFPNRDRNFMKFPVSDVGLLFFENCIKIALEITKLRLIKFRFVVGFDMNILK